MDERTKEALERIQRDDRLTLQQKADACNEVLRVASGSTNRIRVSVAGSHLRFALARRPKE